MATKNKYIEALSEANLTYEAVRAGVRLKKGEQIRKLAEPGIFTSVELQELLGTGNKTVWDAVLREPVIFLTAHTPAHGNTLTGATVGLALALAKSYHERGNLQAGPVLLAMQSIGLTTTARVTGIPKNILRKVAHGATYLSGVLNERA